MKIFHLLLIALLANSASLQAAVNQPPSFSKGANQTVLEDSGPKSVANWATKIKPGPASESSQAVAFTATADNIALFSTLPAITPAGTLTFTPAADAFGKAIVTVLLKDNGGTANGGKDTSGPQTFTITVAPVNDPPSFTKGVNQSILEDAGPQKIEGWAANLSVGPSNEGPSGQKQKLSFVATPDNKALFSKPPSVDAAGSLFYTPAKDAHGIATVSLQAKDSGGTAGGGVNLSPVQTFTITVASVNDPPSFVKGPNVTVLEDSGPKSIEGWVKKIAPGPPDESAQSVTFTVTHDNPSLFSVEPVITTTGTLAFTPAANAFGRAVISLVLKDNGGVAQGGNDTSAVQSFFITVVPVNDPPAFTKGASQTVLEDAGSQKIEAWASNLSVGPENEGPSGQKQKLNFAITTDNKALFAKPPVIDAAGTLTYTPAKDANGAATVSVQAKDSGSTAHGGVNMSAVQTFSITVTLVNDPPSFARGQNITVLEDAGPQTVEGWVKKVAPGPPDESSQTLVFTVSNDHAALFAAPPAITLAGNLTFTPAANAFGKATVTAVLKDNGGTAHGGSDTSAPQSFIITVLPVNDAPSFDLLKTAISVLKDSGEHSIAVAAAISKGPSNEETQRLNFTVTPQNAELFTGKLAIDPNTGVLTFKTKGLAGSTPASVELLDTGGTANGGANKSGPKTLTITLAEAVPPALSISNVSQNEGLEGFASADFAVTLSVASTETVTVNYATANGTAIAGSDYLAASGTVTFSPGQTTKTLSIQIVGDTAVEPNETFFVNLSSPANATLAKAQGIGTIVNDDIQVRVPPILGVMPDLTLEKNTAIHPGPADLRDYVTDPDSEAAAMEFRIANLDAIQAAFGLTDGENGGPAGFPVVTIGMDPDSSTFKVRPGTGAMDNTIHVHPRKDFTGSTAVVIEARDAEGQVSNSRAFTVTVRSCSTVVYQEDFEGKETAGPEWSVRNIDTTPAGRRKFLGQLGNDTAALSLANLPPHASIRIEFDLFIIRTWDGSAGTCCGPDIWSLGIDGGPTLLRTTFDTVDVFPDSSDHYRQSFPSMYPKGNYPARTGAVENNTLGYFYTSGGVTSGVDSVYRLSFYLSHTESSLVLNFSASGLQSLQDESWGIDKIRIEADCSAPSEGEIVKQWEHSFGGTGDDVLRGLWPTSDGGYIVVGHTDSDVSGNKTLPSFGGLDGWVIKVDALGQKEWESVFGGEGADALLSVQQTFDGGYILAGISNSPISGNKTVPSFGSDDGWLIKLAANGSREWERVWGSEAWESLRSVQQTADGGYICAAGITGGSGGNRTSESFGQNDCAVVRFDANGNVLWDAGFGGTANDSFDGFNTFIQQASDGGYLFLGHSFSGASGNKTSSGRGGADFFVVKLNADGSKQWEESYGGSRDDDGLAALRTADDGYVMGGLTRSGVSGNKTTPAIGDTDFWMIKTNPSGVKQWERTFGGSGRDDLTALDQTVDGGYILAGNSSSGISGSKTTEGFGGSDFWVVRLDANGVKMWDRTFGGAGYDGFVSAIHQTADGGYLLGGPSSSGVGGNKTATHFGAQDFWIVKLVPNNVPAQYTFSTWAGLPGSSGSTEGRGGAARFAQPAGAASDSAGNVYVADHANHTIRKITPAGEVTTLAGLAGSFGSADGTGSEARFYGPRGVAVDSAGTVYVADLIYVTIRRITPAGEVSTLAGLSGNPGSMDGQGSEARFSGPAGVAVDSAFNVYVVEYENFTIRKITPAGMVTTLAGLAGNPGSSDGTGGQARFNYPQGIAVDMSGTVYVADSGNHTIRRISPNGAVTTLAGLAETPGSVDGTGSAARFNEPVGVAVDNSGNVFVVEHNHTVRKISPSGLVATIGGLSADSGSVDGVGSAARFNHPVGIGVDSAGRLYVADTFNHTIRLGISGGSPPSPNLPAEVLSAKQHVAGRAFPLNDSLALPTRPSPAPQILNAVRAGATFQLSITTTPGTIYRLEAKNSLRQSDWERLTLATGDGTVQWLTDSAASDTERFYRVRIVSPP